MRTNFCPWFVNKRPRKIEIAEIKITLFREIIDLCIPTMSFSVNQKNLKFPIDESIIIQYIDYGERRNRESRIAPILVKTRKNDRADRFGNAHAPQGRILSQQARYLVGTKMQPPRYTTC